MTSELHLDSLDFLRAMASIGVVGINPDVNAPKRIRKRYRKQAYSKLISPYIGIEYRWLPERRTGTAIGGYLCPHYPNTFTFTFVRKREESETNGPIMPDLPGRPNNGH